MSTYACSEEGVAALNSLVRAIEEGIETIQSETNNLSDMADEYAGTLGPHQASLKSALENIRDAINQSTTPASEVGERLAEVAKDYQAEIDDDPYSSAGN